MLNVVMLSVANKPFTLSVFMLNVAMLTVAMLSVFMLNVMSPCAEPSPSVRLPWFLDVEVKPKRRCLFF